MNFLGKISFSVLVYAFKQLGLYPVNTLRNVAMENARTSHVFTLDADFVPNMGALQYIKCVTSII